jgi:hypothetical protein
MIYLNFYCKKEELKIGFTTSKDFKEIRGFEMDPYTLIGLLVLLAGVFLIGYGIRSSQTITDRMVGGLTGRYTRSTMWYLIGGLLLVLVGGAMMYFGHGPVVVHP